MQSFFKLLIIFTSLLLSGCLNHLLDRNCHYRPVYGIALLTPADQKTMNVTFQPEQKSGLTLFKNYNIDPENLSLPRRAASRGGRYKAIANIRTSGQCIPYIIYLSSPLQAPPQSDAG